MDFGGEGGGGNISLAAIFEGKHISLVICVRGNTYHGGTHISVTPVPAQVIDSNSLEALKYF